MPGFGPAGGFQPPATSAAPAAPTTASPVTTIAPVTIVGQSSAPTAQPPSGRRRDLLSLTFEDPKTGQIKGTLSTTGEPSLTNYTQVSFERDFFHPYDALAFSIAGPNLNTFIVNRGWRVNVKINNKTQMIGYVFDYEWDYNRDHGNTLTIRIKDLLAYMDQGTIYPNVGTNSATNYHFPAGSSLQFCLQKICQTFWDATGSQPFDIVATNGNDLSASSGRTVGDSSDDFGTISQGFQKGLRGKGKSQSLTTALNHLTTPMKGESYLAYMRRLAKLAGCQLKMSSQDPYTVICKPPTYNRTNTQPFDLVHIEVGGSGSELVARYIKKAKYKFNLDKQPSVVVVEVQTSSPNGAFYQGLMKGIAINELTGYPLYKDMNNVPINPEKPVAAAIPNVLDAFTALTNGKQGIGCVVLPFRNALYQQRYNMNVDIDTTVSLPLYIVSTNAHSANEAGFAAAEMLAEHQDRYFEATYTVKGWTLPGDNSSVWAPDMLINVKEETVFAGNKGIVLWIRRVRFIQTKDGGTETEILCTLPYTHSFPPSFDAQEAADTTTAAPPTHTSTNQFPTHISP